eukprot:5284686-Pyramimonas_sp.AAC.1
MHTTNLLARLSVVYHVRAGMGMGGYGMAPSMPSTPDAGRQQRISNVGNSLSRLGSGHKVRTLQPRLLAKVLARVPLRWPLFVAQTRRLP